MPVLLFKHLLREILTRTLPKTLELLNSGERLVEINAV
jgi:hypothetical protein